jgi:hypothetical protein
MAMGWTPIRENIALSLGDFIYERTSPNAVPAGTTAEIVWANSVTWAATVDGNTVSWRVEAQDCDAETIPHGTTFDMFIRYPNPDTETEDDFHWKTGRALRTPND